MKKLFAIILSFCLIISCFALLGVSMNYTPKISIEEFSAELSEMNRKYKEEPVSNRLIVKSKRDIAALDSVDIVEGYADLHIVQFDNSKSAKEALEFYENNRYIEYAEEDNTVSTFETTPTQSANYGNHLSWGSDSIGVDDYFSYLDGIQNLPEIVVGIIDTGIDLDHDFLKDRIIRTYFNNSGTGEDSSENDDQGHGTHVAGIIVDNSTENVKIKSFKCLDSNGNGTYSSIITAIYAANESDVNVINMSLGGYGKNVAMEEAVNKAIESNITVCVAAGNNGWDANTATPANIEPCITVGAIDEFDDAPYWTNWGDCVDIVAPGVSIYSSWLGNKYEIKSGTSMASPFVAAASALLLSYNPNLTPAEIDEMLKEDGRVWTNDITEPNADKKALYIGVVKEHVIKERAKKPDFNYKSGNYREGFYLEITSDEEDAQIFYTLDGSSATETSGTLYSEPIWIDKTTNVHASVYVEGKFRSVQQVAQYYVTSTDPDNMFEINDEGIITKYYGNNIALTIPDMINNKVVRGIGESVFERSDMYIISFPDTLTLVGEHAFDLCEQLTAVYADNIKSIGTSGFDTCMSLLDIDLTNLESVGKHAFDGCISLSSVYNEKLTEITEFSFCCLDGVINLTFTDVKKIDEDGLYGLGDMTIVSLNLPSVETLEPGALSSSVFKDIELPKLKELKTTSNGIGNQFGHCVVLESVCIPAFDGVIPTDAFSGCNKLEMVYAPNARGIESDAFNYTDYPCLFIPKAEYIRESSHCSKLTVFATERLNDIDEMNGKDVTIVAPGGSYSEEWANDNNHSFIDSYTMVDYRFSYDLLSVNYRWGSIDEIEQLADKITYSFDVDGEEVEADTVHTENGTTYFSYQTESDDEQTVRAVVNIDGMLFKSEPVIVSRSAVTEPDNGCEHEWTVRSYVSKFNDTIITLHCSKCGCDYIVSFSNYLNRDFPPLDLNNDGIVNAKDYAIIKKTNSKQ